MSASLWISVVVIGLGTYVARLLPLVLPERWQRVNGSFHQLHALGPCLLAAMATSILIPEFLDARSAGTWASFAMGLAFAGVAMVVRRDPGVAAVAGVFGWWIIGGAA